MLKTGSFKAQTWAGSELLSEIDDLSYDAAREIASAAPITGHTGRLMSNERDYCEVFSTLGYREGTFAETTYIRA